MFIPVYCKLKFTSLSRFVNTKTEHLCLAMVTAGLVNELCAKQSL
jgi:hypothetical protein